MNKRNIWIATGSLGVLALGASAAAADGGAPELDLRAGATQTATQAATDAPKERAGTETGFNADDFPVGQWGIAAAAPNDTAAPTDSPNTANTPNTAPSPNTANTPNTAPSPMSAPSAQSAQSAPSANSAD